MRKLDHFLKHALTEKASDIHLSAGERIRMRVNGELETLDLPALEPKELQDILFETLNDHERQKFTLQKNLHKAYSLKGIANFRLNVFMTRKGIAAVARMIPAKVPSMEDLGVPTAFQSWLDKKSGILLITGQTGSGKSTTLASLIENMNGRQERHILTIEETIEFIHESDFALVSQREVGHSCHLASEALRSAWREDADVLVVSELIDKESMALALNAAASGHLVIAAIPTRGVVACLNRIVDSFPSGEQAMARRLLAEQLIGVTSQILVARADGKGRMPAFEILVNNAAVSTLLYDGKINEIATVMASSRREGMVTADQAIQDLAQKGLIKAEEAAAQIKEGMTVRNLRSAPPPMPAPVITLAPPMIPTSSQNFPKRESAEPAVPNPAKPFVATPPPVPKTASALKSVESATNAIDPGEKIQIEDEEPILTKTNIEAGKEQNSFNNLVTDLTEGKEESTLIYDSKAANKVTKPVPTSVEDLIESSLPDREEVQDRPPLIKPLEAANPPAAPQAKTPPPLPAKKKAS